MPATDFLLIMKTHNVEEISFVSGHWIQIPLLCPVRALKEYLNRTSYVKTGDLFIFHNRQRALSKVQITTRCCPLLGPQTLTLFSKTHDVRKYATSMAFLNEAHFPDLLSYTGWSLVKVFLEHYRWAQEYEIFGCGSVGRYHRFATILEGPP